MTPPLACVGALVRDGRNRVYAQRRTAERRLFPGIWDIVGGHVEPGETPEAALAREIEEETGWTLRRIEAVVADWEWEYDGVVRHELDYLVDVDGDLDAPRLEEGKHDASAWVGPGDLELMMVGRTDGDRRLRDLVAMAVRTRLTDRLRLEPARPGHAADLRRLHLDEAVAYWHGGAWSEEDAATRAADLASAWEADGVGKWLAYARDTGELVGRGGLSYVDVDGDRRLEVGWTVRSDLWGRGYATEIGRAALAFASAELGADEVVAFTERHNARSRAVMERLGMRYVRELRRPGLVEGRDGVHDDAPFALYVAPRATPG
ncbi:MAG: GNAT family N-acetyltransferase [Streptosporangiales bacterium]|nr:GNAT family N-acetyltransferase [Streptosporangiales bacterium]